MRLKRLYTASIEPEPRVPNISDYASRIHDSRPKQVYQNWLHTLVSLLSGKPTSARKVAPSWMVTALAARGLAGRQTLQQNTFRGPRVSLMYTTIEQNVK